MDGTGRLIEPLAARMQGEFDTTIVEYPRAESSYEKLVQLAVERLPRDRDFVIVGESFAGPIALRLAAQRPAGLRGVVLSASFARYPVAMLRALAPLVRVLPARAAPMTMLTKFVLARWDEPTCRRWLLDNIEGVPADVLRARVAAALAVDATPALGAIDVPLLYLRASQDRVIGRHPADEIVASVRDATIVEVDGPHFLLQVATDACAAAIDAFARQLVGAT